MASPRIVQKMPFVVEETPGAKWWCACGLSKGQPYCDGSHKGSGMQPIKVDIAQAARVAWCGCKQSKSGAFCDGTHSAV